MLHPLAVQGSVVDTKNWWQEIKWRSLQTSLTPFNPLLADLLYSHMK